MKIAKWTSKAITVLSLMIMLSLVAMPVSAAVTHNLTATPGGTITWGTDGVVIHQTVIESTTDGTLNGTVYCTLTNPEGYVTHYSSVMNITSGAKTWYYNWTVLERMTVSGDYSVLTHFHKGAGTLDAPADHTLTFTVERASVYQANQLNEMTQLSFFLFMVVVFMVMLIMFMHMFEKGGKKE
jgi:hypothetical protein